ESVSRIDYTARALEPTFWWHMGPTVSDPHRSRARDAGPVCLCGYKDRHVALCGYHTIQLPRRSLPGLRQHDPVCVRTAGSLPGSALRVPSDCPTVQATLTRRNPGLHLPAAGEVCGCCGVSNTVFSAPSQ
ncbi:hypothetical protein FKM82_030436, partial [Ascaphus truei]